MLSLQNIKSQKKHNYFLKTLQNSHENPFENISVEKFYFSKNYNVADFFIETVIGIFMTIISSMRFPIINHNSRTLDIYVFNLFFKLMKTPHLSEV